MRRALIALAAFAAVVAPLAAHAQDSGGCAKFKWSIERERSAFAAPGLPTLTSSSPPPGIMSAVAVRLAPQAEVHFVRPPGRPPRANPAFGGVLTLAPIAEPGTYQITLSDDAWIDVIQNDTSVRSTGFSGQTLCPGVRKSVKFPLKSGPATVQISGAGTDSVTFEILPAE